MLYKELVSLGLGEKEAKIYLAALELGPSPVQTISRKAGVNRATTYANIEGLMKMHLMSSYRQGKKQFFYAEPPEKIVYILIKKQQDELKEKESNLNKIIPELKALRSQAQNMPVVRYFDGRKEILELAHELQDEAASSKEDDVMREIYARDLLYSFYSKEEISKIVARRVGKDIPGRAISVTKDTSIAKVQKTDVIYLTPEELDMGCDITFYGNSMSIISFKDPLAGILIKDANIARSFKNIFDLLWKLLAQRQIK